MPPSLSPLSLAAAPAPLSLQEKKQQLVREAIADAALELFAEVGYEACTVEQIADRAGVSRRTFFRYSRTKDDLITEPVAKFGEAILRCLAAQPAASSPAALLGNTVREVAGQTVRDPRAIGMMRLSANSLAVRATQLNRLAVVEEEVAQALAKRLGNSSKAKLQSRLLAANLLAALSLCFRTWLHSNQPPMSKVADQVLAAWQELQQAG